MYKANGVEDDGAETALTLLESSSKEKIIIIVTVFTNFNEISC